MSVSAGRSEGPLLAATLLREGVGAALAYVPEGTRAVEFYDLQGRLVGAYAPVAGSTVAADLPVGHYVIVGSGDAVYAPQRVLIY